MSRSIRKKANQLLMSGATSEKKDKRIANRKFRRRIKASTLKDEGPLKPLINEVSDKWNFAKDGWHWIDKPQPEHFRK